MSRLQDFINIIKEVKVPKSRTNTYASSPFQYRNAEDILTAFKHPLEEQGFHIKVEDSVVNIGDHNYFKSVAIVVDCSGEEGKVILDAVGYAREAVSRKGFDDSQLSGSASSYAKKYALNNLLMLDDGVDADGLDNSYQGQERTAPKPVTVRDTAKPAAKAEPLVCSDCGVAITQGAATISKMHYGRPLCVNCQQKAEAAKKKGE